MRLFKSLNLFKEIYKSGVIYPVPPTISYLWNFGSLALLCLGVQVVTGVFLAMHYAAHVDLAFNSVEHIMREVNNGWLLRYTHFNGASMFFLVVYIHMFRGLYYGSFMYPRILVWSVGVAILFLMMGTAFMGYVLPWGQMSFWAATVITNLASAFPLVGKPIVYWLWGGFSVDNATLNRFFSFHYIMPFILIGLVGLHVLMLHDPKSGNPMGIQTRGVDVIPLMPYFGVKDLLGYLIFVLLFIYFVFFDPNVLGHPDNYIKANPLVTPAHIVPEWYFLPFYAILRVVPSKIGGVLLMLSAILILLVIPFIVKPTRRGFRPLHTIFFWIFVSNCFILGWIGGNPAEEPFTFIGSFATGVYFLYFLIIMPFVDYVETRLLSYYNK